MTDAPLVRLGSACLWLSAATYVNDVFIAVEAGKWGWAVLAALAVAGYCLMGREVWKAASK